MINLISIKKLIKYVVFGTFIGMLLVYLKFKRVRIEE